MLFSLNPEKKKGGEGGEDGVSAIVRPHFKGYTTHEEYTSARPFYRKACSLRIRIPIHSQQCLIHVI